MAYWTTTKAKIQQRVEIYVRRVTGANTLTRLEKEAIADGINMCLVDIATDKSFGQFNAVMSDTTADTTANINYVNLAEGVIQVIDGTVRIEAEDQTLTRIPFSHFFALDPGENTTGTPSAYAIGGDVDYLRLYLRDTPDAVYTIAYTARIMPDEDEIGQFPDWFMPLIISGSFANSLDLLGLDSRQFWATFERRRRNARIMQAGHLGPEHVAIRGRHGQYRHPELRRP